MKITTPFSFLLLEQPIKISITFYILNRDNCRSYNPLSTAPLTLNIEDGALINKVIQQSMFQWGLMTVKKTTTHFNLLMIRVHTNRLQGSKISLLYNRAQKGSMMGSKTS